MKSLDNLLHLLQPKAVIPIHTDSPQTFAKQFKDKWHVLLLHDGETFHAISWGNCEKMH